MTVNWNEPDHDEGCGIFLVGLTYAFSDYSLMTMAKNAIPAGEFKSRCLALLDDVAQTGRVLIVTKRGRPVAKVVPIDNPAPIDGSVLSCDNLLAPAIDEEDWNMNKGRC